MEFDSKRITRSNLYGMPACPTTGVRTAWMAARDRDYTRVRRVTRADYDQVSRHFRILVSQVSNARVPPRTLGHPAINCFR